MRFWKLLFALIALMSFMAFCSDSDIGYNKKDYKKDLPMKVFGYMN